MVINGILITIILIIIMLIFINTTKSTTQKNGNINEQFTGNSGTINSIDRQNYIKTSQDKFNVFTNIVNLTDPAIPSSDDNIQATIDKALSSLNTIPTATTYKLEQNNPFKVSGQMPVNFEAAMACEKAANSCESFDNQEFASKCGISFDMEGLSFDGKPHIGGMYISENDRREQLKRAEIVKTTRSPPYDPVKVFQPTLGKAAPGKFAITKDQCISMKERIECEKKQTFDSANCAQCYTSQKFSRIDSAVPRIGSDIYMIGDGVVSIVSSQADLFNGADVSRIQLNPTNPTSVSLSSNAEGARFTIKLTGDPTKAFISGLLYAKTAKGYFKYDLYNMVESDSISKAKPRLGGVTQLYETTCFVMMTGTGQKTASFECVMPFSFLSLTELDTLTCDNGPIITKASSAQFLNSDSCHTKESAPGKYSLECLQEKFVQLGGTNKGSGYPSTPQKAAELMFDANGKAFNIEKIADNIYKKILAASTGRREDGTILSITEWNDNSVWSNGKSINTPCDTPGSVSRDCMSYLYNNMGVKSHIGATYTLPMNYTSSNTGVGGTVGTNVYCVQNSPIDPSTEDGYAFGKSLVDGGIVKIKETYDKIHRTANDNTLSNEARSSAIKQCYGIDIAKRE